MFISSELKELGVKQDTMSKAPFSRCWDVLVTFQWTTSMSPGFYGVSLSDMIDELLTEPDAVEVLHSSLLTQFKYKTQV